jgi:hypothetical protein
VDHVRHRAAASTTDHGMAVTALSEGVVNMTETPAPQLPQPDPALKKLDRFVGTWSMAGDLVGGTGTNIRGQASFRWLPGGFFLEQHIELDFLGLTIDSTELVGYDPETKRFPSTVYSNMSPAPLPYLWDVDGEDVTITVSYGPLDSTFEGRFGDDGRFSGGWRPNPGADPAVNVAYDLSGERLS